MSKKIIIINGGGGVGKDLIVWNIKRILYDKDIVVHNISSVERVKNLATIMGWDGTKDEKSRKFLSDLKRIWTEFNDGLFLGLTKRIELINDENCLVFVHIREVNEIIRAVENWEDVTTLLVTRPGVELFSNDSDSKVSEYKYDYVINNDKDIEELRDYVLQFLHDIKVIS